MALNAIHPKYEIRLRDWRMMRDFYDGERKVKEKGEEYLPATKSMKLDGMGFTAARMNGAQPRHLGYKNIGQEAYDAYRLRAVFPDYVKDAVETYIGIMHQKPPTIELPPQLEPMRDKATTLGESLELLLRRINEEQLTTGRVGLLLDLPVLPQPDQPTPYIAMYVAESIRNWDDGYTEKRESKLNMVVLDESGFYRESHFEWTITVRFRVLWLGNWMNETQDNTPPTEGVYWAGVYDTKGGSGAVPEFVQEDMTAPVIRGQTLNEIPFVFINSKDIVPEPDNPPLLGLAYQTGAIYRGEADYRQNLFMQGQDTLVIVGDRKKSDVEINSVDNEPLRTGAGSRIDLDLGGSAEYIGVHSEGLAEQRTAIASDRSRAEQKSGILLNNTNNASNQESGEALQTRVGAQTASLTQIAKAGAAGLESILKICARWMGADDSKVKVVPNLEFSDFLMTGQNLVQLMTARSLGAPISLESIHGLMANQGLTQMDYLTEKATLDTEQDEAAQRLAGTGAGGNPDPNAPPGQQVPPGQQPKPGDPPAPKQPSQQPAPAQK